MANSLQTTLNWSGAYLRYAPQNVGASQEPALSNASLIRQTILNPPFTWAWNRNTISFALAAGQQDYKQTLTDFSFIESASLQPSATITNVAATGGTATITAKNSFISGTSVTLSGLQHTALNVTATIITASPTQFTFASAQTISSVADSGTAISGQVFQITGVKNTDVLSESSDMSRPTTIGYQRDDGSGTITFRFMNVPDQQYQVTVNYQKAPASFTATGNLWSPVPDSFSDIYNSLFLSYCFDAISDSRAAYWRQRGIAALLGKAQGLDEMDRQLFLAQYLQLDVAAQNSRTKAAMGVQSRGV